LKLHSRYILIASAFLLAALPLMAGKPKAPPVAPPKVVDEGSFSVVVNGERVATETFTISQTAEGSVTKAEIKLKDGKPSQSSEMKMAGNGNLIVYQWDEMEPPKGKNVVEPSNDFLVEHYSRPDGKVGDQPFLMPASSVILDDFFFSHRQLLLWRYLGASCGKNGPKSCEFSKTQYGVVIPRQRLSSMVSVEYISIEKVAVKGVTKELTKFRLTTEGPEWFVWVDEAYKIQRISVPETATEVNRE